MSDYRIQIIIDGKDQASAPLVKINSVLGSMGQIAGGILTAGLLTRLGDGVFTLGRKAFDSVGQMQMLQLSLESLAATEAISQNGTLNFAQALDQASPKAQNLMNWLRALSVRSPFEYKTVADVFRFNMAFGQTADISKQVTEATLNFAAATGLSQDELSRFSYNLAQIGSQQKITAMDIRQLSMTRFGLTQLNGVFDILSEKTKTQIRDHEDFNAALASGRVSVADFYQAFSEYSNKMYGSSAERMVRTLPGLMSNMKDVMFFGLADTFGPLGDRLVNLLSPLFDKLTAFAENGGFKQIGEKIGKTFDDVEASYRRVKSAFTSGGAEGGINAILKELLPDDQAAALKPLVSDLIKIGQESVTFVNTQLLPALSSFGGWVMANKDQILAFLTGFLGTLLAVRAVQGIGTVIAGFKTALAGLGAIASPVMLAALSVGLLLGLLERYGTTILGADAANATFLQRIQVGFWGILNNAATTVSMIGQIISTVVTNTLKSAVTTISQMGGIIRSKIGEFTSAGSALIEGMWKGIKDKFDTIIQRVKALIAGLPAAVKKVLGIESPSKVFAEIGQQSMAGLALGIERSFKMPQLAMSGALDALTGLSQRGSNTYQHNFNDQRNVYYGNIYFSGNSPSRTDLLRGLSG